MAAASSEATEQLATAAKTNLLQIQAILAAQSEEGASRLRDAQITFITTRRERSSSTSASHVSQPNSQESAIQQSGAHSAITARDTLSDGHSYAQTAIRGNLWRHEPVKVSWLIRSYIDLRCVAVRPAGTHFSSVSRRRMMSIVHDRH